MSAFVAGAGLASSKWAGSRLQTRSARPQVAVSHTRSTVRFFKRSATTMAASLHEIKMNDIDGTPVDFSSAKGKVVLAVNVACQCGMTRGGYTAMKNLADKYGDKVSVFAFPSNEFGGQEPGSPDEIKAFVNGNFGNPKIKIMEKSLVKGASANEVFKMAKEAGAGQPSWNFDGRLLFGKDGAFATRLTNSATEADIDAEIQKLL